MYLRLGTTNIKYSTEQDDFTVFSEVVDSKMSYEKPILVRTPDELDIWFGSDFPGKDYYDELLESGVTLFLYRPIKVEQNTNAPDYVDLKEYSIDQKLYYNLTELPEIGEDKVLYKVVTGEGEYKEGNLWYTLYIYYLGEYMKILELPQNLDTNNTSSLENRDVLNINYQGFIGPEYCYPKYIEEGDVDYTEKINEEILLSHLPDLLRVSKGYETLAYSLVYNPEIDFHPIDEGLTSKYIILKKLKNDSYENIMIWFKEEINSIPNIPSQYYDEAVEVEIKAKESNKEIFKRLVEVIIPSQLGYTVEGNISEGYKIYTSYSVQVTYFTNITDLLFEPDFNTTHNILSKISSGSTRVRFISKTTGTEGGDPEYLDSDISVNIEKLKGDDKYRVTIERYKYQEIYEGGLFTIGQERLDTIITSESKLVRCILSTSYINRETGEEVEYKKGTKESELPSGTWYLKRAWKETAEDINGEYWKAAEAIFGSDNAGIIDYFLVPDIYKYSAGMKTGSETSYYPEYERFLGYARSLGFQVLFQNSDNGWTYVETQELPSAENITSGTIYIVSQPTGGVKFYKVENGNLIETTDPEETNTAGNNYVFNYTSDTDNRLLYFYRGQTIFGQDRPGYYLHIRGLLQDIYSITSDQILYQTPTTDPYTFESPEEKLEEYKSNYLVFNNQIYYYKKYQNGQDFNTSGWMRFCIGKVARELEKNKWKILSTKSAGDIRARIEQILNRISAGYSYIDSLVITGFYLDLPNNRLGLEVESRMSDLVDNDMTIDITLNYDKK